jgi:hypothetical protein
VELESIRTSAVFQNCTALLPETLRAKEEGLELYMPKHVAVAGGPNTAGGQMEAGDKAWPQVLQVALKTKFGPNSTFEIHNAAQVSFVLCR